MRKINFCINIAFLTIFLSLTGCTVRNTQTIPPTRTKPPLEMAYLQQGKRYFEQGYYRKAMHELLPLACDGDAEAQYAVGYMYYYGYGVAQDTDAGYFWIRRSAEQHYVPACRALALIEQNKAPTPPVQKTLSCGKPSPT